MKLVGVGSGRNVDVGATGELSMTGVSDRLATVDMPAGAVAAGEAVWVAGTSLFWHATRSINRNGSARMR